VAYFTNSLTATQVRNLYNSAGVPPSVTMTVTSQTNNDSDVVTNIAAGVEGSLPVFTYWYKNTVPTVGSFLPAQTAVNLVFNPIHGTDAGNYVCVASNLYGMATGSVVNIKVLTLPVIISQSPPGVTSMAVYANALPTLGVVADGKQPLSYQWQLDQGAGYVAISGATLNTLGIAPVLAGSYKCVITNTLGSAATVPVALTIVPSPVGAYPTNVLNDHPIAYFRLGESGDQTTPMTGGIAYDNAGGNNATYTNTILGVLGYQGTNEDTAALFGKDLFGNPVASNSYAGGSPLDMSVTNGANGTFSVEAWVNGAAQVADAGIVNQGYGGGGETFHLDTGSDNTAQGYNHYWRFGVRDQNQGVSRNANSTNFGPDGNWHHLVGVVDQAHSRVYLYVDGVTNGISVIATNAGILKATPSIPLSIGSRPASITDIDFTNQFVGTIDEVAIYKVALTPAQIGAHYSAATTKPQIQISPTPVTNIFAEGMVTNLSITAVGTPPLFYQWYTDDGFGGTNTVTLASATTPILTFNPVVAASASNYFCVVQNAIGQAISSNAIVQVISGPPVLSSNIYSHWAGDVTPSALTIYAGSTFTYNFSVQGTMPITYAWQVNTGTGYTNIPGATLSSLVASNAGSYKVIASNSLGFTNSVTSALSYTPKPTAAYPVAVIADKPAGYWRLGEASYANGMTAWDYVGGHNGIYHNVSGGRLGYQPLADPDTSVAFGTFVAGGIANSIPSYVGEIPGVDFGAAVGTDVALTMEVMVKFPTPQSSDTGVMSFGYGNGGEQYELDFNSNSGTAPRFFVRDGSANTHGLNGQGGYADNQWHHIVCIFDENQSTLLMYIDGQTNGTGAVLPQPGQGVLPIRFDQLMSLGSRQSSASSGYNLPWNGYIDEAALYPYALSQAQVLNHYAIMVRQPVVLTCTNNRNGTITMTWNGFGYTLQASPYATTNAAHPTSGFTNVTGASSPWTVTVGNTAPLFYRVKVQ